MSEHDMPTQSKSNVTELGREPIISCQCNCTDWKLISNPVASMEPKHIIAYECSDCRRRFLKETHHELQQKQAELGLKFPYGKHPVGENGNYQLYRNDIILVDNTILIKSKDTQISIITSNAINLMLTHNHAFFEYNYNWGRNLLTKSILISGTAEKERNKFFLKLREQVYRVADQL